MTHPGLAMNTSPGNITLPDLPPMSGMNKAATFLLSLPESYVAKVFANLDDAEIRELSARMATLGMVRSDIVEALYIEFADKATSSGSVQGSFESTERLLLKIFDRDKVRDIMDEIRGPAGRTMWDKLSNISDDALTNFLKNEHPQTVAVVLSKIRPEQSSKVLAKFPEPFSIDVMMRMIKMDTVGRDVLDDIESTLRTEFMGNLAKSGQKDTYAQMADVFNSFDRATEGRFMTALGARSPDAVDRIKSLMFTFEDLLKLDASGIQSVIRVADKSKMALALKGASAPIKELFFKNMSERAGKLLKEDMESLGMVKLKAVDEAQQEIVTQTKDLINRGEITLMGGDDSDAMIE